MVVPWTNVETRRGTLFFILDDQGRPMGSGRRVRPFALTKVQGSAARRLMRRARRQALASGRLEMVEQINRAENRLEFLGGVTIAAIMIGVVVLSVVYPPTSRTSSPADLLLCLSIFLPLVGAMAYWLWFDAPADFSPAVSVRVWSGGVERRFSDRPPQTHAWTEIQSISRWFYSPRWRVRLRDGSRFAITARRTAFVFEHYREQLLRAQGRWNPPNMRAAKIRAAIYFQVAGIVAYALLTWARGHGSNISPLWGSVFVALAAPGGCVLLLMFALWLERRHVRAIARERALGRKRSSADAGSLGRAPTPSNTMSSDE